MVNRLSLMVAVFLVLPWATLAQPAASVTPLMFIVAYADGRTSVEPLRPVFRFWTPAFGRTPETNPAVRAIDISGKRDGDEAVVTVAVLLNGVAVGDRVPIATVRVAVDGGGVVIEDQSYGT